MHGTIWQLVFTQFVNSNQYQLCGSRKYPSPPHGWSLEFPRGLGVKGQNFTGKYVAKLEFPEGWEGGGCLKKKHLPSGRYVYFLELHITVDS